MNDERECDGALVARARSGDARAFEDLVRRHTRAALRVAFAILGRQADAEDACQDAWVRALEKLETCRKPERFVFWFLQIVRNRARNMLDARRVRSAEPLESESAADLADPRGSHRGERLRARLEKALAEIPQIQREIVLLHDLEGWSHREIAQAAEISEVMSRQHLFQARRRLRELLGAEALGDLSDDG
ncbi:MAG: sigma-70 family RNA polymerase sigma factor [Candidatus Latescibacteria bacterium]|nr:sigma-70 family RNA polymerase sigma factor [Candidatus Latescibacterota bacterium]